MKYKLTFPSSQMGPTTEYNFPPFLPEDWRIMMNFMTFSDEAHRTRFARELLTYRVSFQFTNSGIVRNTGQIPDEEALSAFLHKYRPILLKSEPTEFTHVCSVIVKHINYPRFTQVAHEWKVQYSGKAIREMFTITQGDIMLISQTFLENYLNAFEYHRDPELRDKLADFTRWFEPDARIALVTLLLTLKFCAVSSLRCAIREFKELRESAEASN